MGSMSTGGLALNLIKLKLTCDLLNIEYKLSLVIFMEALETHWIERLEHEDLTFIKRFILLSGSLKDLADAYGVSYPTLRLRLDRLIQKIKILDSEKIEDGYERVLRAQFADGKLDASTFKQLLTAYLEQKKGSE